MLTMYINKLDAFLGLTTVKRGYYESHKSALLFLVVLKRRKSNSL